MKRVDPLVYFESYAFTHNFAGNKSAGVTHNAPDYRISVALPIRF